MSRGFQMARPPGLLPPAEMLIDAFVAGHPPGSAPSPLVAWAAILAVNHQNQWSAEDAARAAGDDHDVARAKATIDQLNARRLELVDDIDSWVAGRMAAAPFATLHTETLGSVVDRLAIAWVRARQLAGHRGDPDQRAAAARRQLTELAQAYDALVRDLMAGTRNVPDWRTLRQYGPGS